MVGRGKANASDYSKIENVSIQSQRVGCHCPLAVTGLKEFLFVNHQSPSPTAGKSCWRKWDWLARPARVQPQAPWDWNAGFNPRLGHTTLKKMGTQFTAWCRSIGIGGLDTKIVQCYTVAAQCSLGKGGSSNETSFHTLRCVTIVGTVNLLTLSIHLIRLWALNDRCEHI